MSYSYIAGEFPMFLMKGSQVVGIMHEEKVLCLRCSRDRNVLEIAGMVEICRSCGEELFTGWTICPACEKRIDGSEVTA